MPTRLNLYCSQVIEAGWLVALVVIPLHFNPLSSEAFESEKIAFLRSIALIMALAWMIKGVLWIVVERRSHAKPTATPPDRGSFGRTMAQHPLVLLAILAFVIYCVATALSILPHVSLWGYHARLHGLYTMAAYFTIFFSLIALLRTHAQVQRLITTTLLASIPFVLYGVFQQVGLDPLAWETQATGRAHSTMGNPIFLGALLSMVVPLTFYRLVEARRGHRRALQACYALLLLLQLAGILITQSRGPVMGLAVALLVGGLLWTLTRHQWRMARAIVGVSLVLVLFLVIVNLPNTPLGFVADLPYLNRLTQVNTIEASAQGRILIWAGAIDLIGAEPARWMLGYGPETIRFAYYPHYSADLGHIHGWNVFFDRMHSETLDVLITTGILGLLTYLLFFTVVAYSCLRWAGVLPTSKHRTAFFICWVFGGFGAPLVLRLVSGAWSYSGLALALGLAGGLFLYLTGYTFFASRETNQPSPPSSSSTMLLIIVLFSGLLGHFIETNVGIAISATRLLFWVYTALFLLMGLVFSAEAEHASVATPRPGKGMPIVRSLCLGLMMATLALSLSAQGIADALVALGSLLVLTASLAAFLVIAETRAAITTPFSLRATAWLIGLSVLPLLLVGLVRATGLQGGDTLHFFYASLVLLVIVVIAAVLHHASATTAQRTPYWAYGLVVASLLGTGMLIHRTNIQVAQANMQHQMAQEAYRQNRVDLAITYYQQALALNPRQDVFLLELAQAMATKASGLPLPEARDELFGDAERLLLQARRRNPFEQFHPAALAEVYRSWAKTTTLARLQAARYEKAAAALDEALQINQENIPVWQQKAILHEETGNRPEAIAAYRRILDWDSTNASLYLQLGLLYREEQRWQEAATMYEGVIRHSLTPLPTTHMALAVIYNELGRQEEAVTQSQHAIALDPDVVVYREILMGLFQSMGRCDEAQRVARDALARWPDNDTLADDLALLEQQCRTQTSPE